VKLALFVLVIVGLLAMGASSKYGAVRSDLMGQRDAVASAWSDVDRALESRASLVDNVVSEVRPVVKDADALQTITGAPAALKAASAPAEKLKAYDRMESDLARLLLLAKNYPKLRTGGDFLRLRDGLSETENRIQIARRKYNLAVQRYNASIALFPNNVVAGLSGFTRNDAYFTTEPAIRTAPKGAH
jgi:LemA protein